MFKRNVKKQTRVTDTPPAVAKATREVSEIASLLKADDPLLPVLLGAKGALDLRTLKLDSPALTALRGQGLRMVMPLISQGEITGILSISERRSEQEISSDDRRILGEFAASAGQAVRVAQLARAQQNEAEQRTRLENELRVARTVQETLLPQALPKPDGWVMDAYWKPAREMSGDFYDFIEFDDGRLGIVVADVTDKGMPAAMVMATTRSLLRTLAEQAIMPGAVLARTNDALCPNIPERMFVTCLYALLDPVTGTLHFSNAGHNLPVLQQADGNTVELRATGMPLGLLPGMAYEQKSVQLGVGDQVLVYSDGLTEAHSPQGEMFGFPRLRELMSAAKPPNDVIAFLREQLDAHVGPAWEQEDDVTFVTFKRTALESSESGLAHSLAQFSLASEPGNEREAMNRVAEIIAPLRLTSEKTEKLKTAVAEAVMNAMEHGNGYDANKPTEIEVCTEEDRLIVRVTDQDGDEAHIPTDATPDLDLKLAGLQSPRGWGLFLIRNMVDEMRHVVANDKHTLELIMNLPSK